MPRKQAVIVECEVCGVETDCTETSEGMYVCSRICKNIAEGTKSGIPLDSMLRGSESGYCSMENSL